MQCAKTDLTVVVKSVFLFLATLELTWLKLTRLEIKKNQLDFTWEFMI